MVRLRCPSRGRTWTFNSFPRGCFIESNSFGFRGLVTADQCRVWSGGGRYPSPWAVGEYSACRVGEPQPGQTQAGGPPPLVVQQVGKGATGALRACRGCGLGCGVSTRDAHLDLRAWLASGARLSLRPGTRLEVALGGQWAQSHVPPTPYPAMQSVREPSRCHTPGSQRCAGGAPVSSASRQLHS